MKKTIVLLFIAILPFIYQGCDQSDDAPEALIFTLKVSPEYRSSGTENWIVLHDANGELIDYKAFENGDTHVFRSTKSTPDNKIAVTIVNYELFDGDHLYTATTDLSINVGSTWELTKPRVTDSPNAGTKVGEFNLKMSAGIEQNSLLITDKNSKIYDRTVRQSTNYNKNLPIYQNSGDILALLERSNGDIKYKFLDDVAPDDQVELKPEEMTDFDQTFEFNFPPSGDVLAFVVQRDPGQGYELNSYLTVYDIFLTRQSMKIGYINSLTRYETSIRVDYPTYNYFYNNVGGVPSSTALPLKSDFTFIDKNLFTFSCISAQPFLVRTSAWVKEAADKTFVWSVNAPSPVHKLGHLPDELISQHPFLDPEGMTYSSSSFRTIGDQYNAGNRPVGTAADQYLVGEQGGITLH